MGKATAEAVRGENLSEMDRGRCSIRGHERLVPNPTRTKGGENKDLDGLIFISHGYWTRQDCILDMTVDGMEQYNAHREIPCRDVG